MKQLNHGWIIEISERELEILAKAYEFLVPEFGLDLARYEELMNQDENLASITFPRGAMIKDMIKLLAKFNNLYVFKDIEEPF